MTTLYKPRPERWPQVGLKGIFAIVALAGVLCWMTMQLKWIHHRHEALAMVRAHQGGLVRYSVDPTANLPLGLRLFGEPSVEAISLLVKPIEHRQLMPELTRLFPEAEMNDVIQWRGVSMREQTVYLDREWYAEEDVAFMKWRYPGFEVQFEP